MKEGAEACWPQLLLVVRYCRLAFTVILSTLFIACFIDYRLFYCTLGSIATVDSL